MQPDYKDVTELIKDKPDIIGNCILFLNWCNPNDSTYDYDAIIALKPLGILAIYEIYLDGPGCAGSYKFYNHMIKDSKYYNIKRSLHLLPYIGEDDDEYELMDIRATWFDNKENIKEDNEENNEQDNIIELHTEIKHNNSCSIM